MVGGRYGKVEGFNFYFQKNDRLKPFQRRKLLTESEQLITELIDEEVNRKGTIENIDKTITQLDPSHCDLELMETWNNLYQNYGYRFDRFKEKWERDSFGNLKDFGNKNDEIKSVNPLKVDWIEKRRNKIKFYDMG